MVSLFLSLGVSVTPSIIRAVNVFWTIATTAIIKPYSMLIKIKLMSNISCGISGIGSLLCIDVKSYTYSIFGFSRQANTDKTIMAIKGTGNSLIYELSNEIIIKA